MIPAFGVLGDQARVRGGPGRRGRDVAVNYGGHVSAGLRRRRRLREQGHGTLVVLSSVAGVRVRRANFVYGSAKAGLDGFAAGPRRRPARHRRAGAGRPAGFVIGRMTAGHDAGAVSA